jgi:hypothetical protein
MGQPISQIDILGLSCERHKISLYAKFGIFLTEEELGNFELKKTLTGLIAGA